MYFLAKQSTFLWKHLIYSMRIYLHFSPFSLSHTFFLSILFSLSLSFSLCYSLSLPFSLSVSLSLSPSLSFYLSLFPNISLSLFLSIYPSFYLSSYLACYLFLNIPLSTPCITVNSSKEIFNSTKCELNQYDSLEWPFFMKIYEIFVTKYLGDHCLVL